MREPLALEIEPGHGGPLFLAIAEAITRDITRGRLKPGARLPGTRALARELGVHRNTVDAAYQELLTQGWLQAEPARGTFVAQDLPQGMLARRSAPASMDPVAPRVGLAFSDGAPDPNQSKSERRKEAYQKFRAKKKNLNFNKTIRYASRKHLAEARPRIRGQFVKCDPKEKKGSSSGKATSSKK